MSYDIGQLPYLGAGLGYRSQISRQIDAVTNEFDFFEVISDVYIRNPILLSDLERITETKQVIPHGIGLSIGSDYPLNRDYLDKVKAICKVCDAPYYSEHLCMTKVPGIDIGHLAPLAFNNKSISITSDNIKRVQDYLGIPLVLENVTYTLELPFNDFSQTDFIHRLVEITGCGLLLDITNVYINSVNHNFNPFEFIDNLPITSVVQVHIAGGYWDDGIMIDGHNKPVQEETWDLLQHLVHKVMPCGVILEHDSDFSDFDMLVNQVKKTRKILSET